MVWDCSPERKCRDDCLRSGFAKCTNRRDVVLAAGIVCQVDKRAASEFWIGRCFEHPSDLRIGDHIGQAIAAQQQPVVGGQKELVQLDIHIRRTTTDSIGHRVSPTMVGRLFGRERASANQFFDVSVIFCQAMETPIVMKVATAISHMGYEQLSAKGVSER